MKLLSAARSWWPLRKRATDLPLEGGMPAWLLSFAVHLCVLVALALWAADAHRHQDLVVISSEVVTPEEPLMTSEEFAYSETPQDQIGASSPGGSDAAVSMAPVVAMSTAAPAALEVNEQGPTGERITIQEEIRVATGPRFDQNLFIKGAAGVGATGTEGAIDRITHEILRSLEERKTLVVWLFDQSGSLERQRAAIISRFDRIYEELGVIEASGNPAFKRHDSKPLVSAVMAFGRTISFLTAKPTDNLDEIKQAVHSLKTDDSGVERTFQAVAEAAERFRQFRTQEPRRNVMFVVLTDEVGDDEEQLDRTVGICRRYEMPVYCIGVPAPFGRRESLVKYVDPDPKFDQTPQWVPIRQGPESFRPELVHLGSEQNDEPMDSGFGPYSLTRLCVETGGIFFAVHPNRGEGRTVSRRETAVLSAQLNHFFDPTVMRNYRPDYISIKEYQKLLSENKARAALVQAAEISSITPMERPQLTFPKLNDADLATRLSRAQQAAAVLEPKIQHLYETLKQGERDRPRLTTPRWQAGYDFSFGRVLALKVRTESYNAMLAKAKQGMRFEDAKNDTWQLVPADEITVGSALEKQAEQARQYLKRVVKEHPQTPWALLAEQELKEPVGWKWRETFTNVNPPRQVAAANNNNPTPRTPANEKAMVIPRPAKRPPPKL